MNFSILRQFDERIKRGFHPELEEPLRHKQIDLLLIVAHHPDMPMRFYARHVHLERGSFTYLCETLEMREYIFRKGDNTDRRKKTIRLTQKGQRVVEELNDKMNEYIANLLNDFTDQQKQDLNQALLTLETLLPKLPKPKRPPHHEHEHPHHHQ